MRLSGSNARQQGDVVARGGSIKVDKASTCQLLSRQPHYKQSLSSQCPDFGLHGSDIGTFAIFLHPSVAPTVEGGESQSAEQSGEGELQGWHKAHDQLRIQDKE